MVGAGGAIASGASAFLIGNGYWLAYNVGAPQFRVGIVSGGALIRGIAWDGADLDIKASYLNLHGNLEIDTGYALQMGGYDYLERSAGVTIITGQTGTTPEKIRLDIAGTQAVGTIWALGLDTLEWTPKDATGATATDEAFLKFTGATATPILNMYSPTASSMFILQLGYDPTHQGTLRADYGEFAADLVAGGILTIGGTYLQFYRESANVGSLTTYYNAGDGTKQITMTTSGALPNGVVAVNIAGGITSVTASCTGSGSQAKVDFNINYQTIATIDPYGLQLWGRLLSDGPISVTNGDITADAGKVISGQLNAVGDIGGVADSIGFTKTSDLTTNDTGVGTIKFKGATSRDSVGFIKIYIGTTAYYIPCFNAITG
jgi:hypothetical protein